MTGPASLSLSERLYLLFMSTEFIRKQESGPKPNTRSLAEALRLSVSGIGIILEASKENSMIYIF